MSTLVNANTKAITQGMTGGTGTLYPVQVQHRARRPQDHGGKTSVIVRIATITTGLASLLVAEVGYAQMRTANPAEIVGAAQTCMTIVSASGVDKAKLTTQGWSAATASRGGKPVPMSVPMYGKGSVVIMLAPDGSPSCFVTARVKTVADAQIVREDLARAVGTAPVGEVNGGPLWLMPGGNAVQFATTGSRDKPSVRIAVVQSSGGKN